MNEQNYASLEASKKLHDADIILETDAVWEEKEGQTRLNLKANCPDGFPAPSIAEAWRELPADIFIDKTRYRLDMWKVDDELRCCYVANGRFAVEPKCSENPTDALIDLLIWVRKEQGNENIGII